MEYLIIDESKCRKDGICVRECPASIIQLSKETGYPEITGDGNCLVCGHCVAVCPNGALSHERILLEDCPPIREDLAIREEQAVQFLRSRRSISHFQDKPVEKEKIHRLIEVARYAPTGGNRQLVEWLVLTDRSRLHTISALTVDWIRTVIKDPQVIAARPYLSAMVRAWEANHDPVLRNAPVLIAASAPREAVNGLIDLTLALCYFELLAPLKGLGTCWAGVLQAALLASDAVREAVGIPEDHPHFYCMMLGYPDVKFYRLPERRPPKITFM